ncbi:MAG: hypothetical protein AAGH72_13665, partial [Verrucomicrobiota bacterium]
MKIILSKIKLENSGFLSSMEWFHSAKVGPHSRKWNGLTTSFLLLIYVLAASIGQAAPPIGEIISL